jgi:hypothetical protein
VLEYTKFSTTVHLSREVLNLVHWYRYPGTRVNVNQALSTGYHRRPLQLESYLEAIVDFVTAARVYEGTRKSVHVHVLEYLGTGTLVQLLPS